MIVIVKSIKDLKYSQNLLKELVKTDFKLRYQGSILGILWSVLKPLALFLVMYTVFVKFLKFTDGTPTFPIVLLLGIALWTFFAEATNVGMRSIVDRGDILRKINFPKIIIVLSTTTGALIGLAINLIVVVVFAIFTGVKFTWWILLAPLGIIQLYALAIGLAFILSTLYVRYRDIGHIWEVILQALFYATPIIYPITMVSSNYPVIAKLIMLSPATQPIQDIRHNLISPSTVPTTWEMIDTWYIAIIPVVITVVLLVIGVAYFNKHSKNFAEDL
ncbi:MAG: ABC transporter permease [Negativicutes bacterium]|nr:ABC transporter permease [Negativicutes bacterium]